MSLIVTGVSKQWRDGRVALCDISFEACSGSITAVIGPSGAGKTTLLKVVAQLYKPDSGSIDGITEQPVMVFQEDSLWPHMTLLENVSLPGQLVKGWSRSAAESRAKEILTDWGLGERLRSFPAELSGGQRQRGALARAFTMLPRIMCLDEITTGLDPETSAAILSGVLRLKEIDTIVLIATHQLSFARAAADRAIFLESGRILEQGAAAQLLSDPRSERVQSFLSAFDFRAESGAIPV
jgi:ABC-type polar amino acid transport system ATPase subunit